MVRTLVHKTKTSCKIKHFESHYKDASRQIALKITTNAKLFAFTCLNVLPQNPGLRLIFKDHKAPMLLFIYL